MEKLVLIDIDGVLNALCNPANPPRISTHWMGKWSNFTITRDSNPEFFENSNPKTTEYLINFSLELLESLSDLSRGFKAENSNIDDPSNEIDEKTHSENLVRFGWLTTWLNSAHEIFCKETGFTEGLNWKVFEGDVNSKIWWKLTVVKEILKENPDLHVIFLEDEVDTEDNIEDFEKLIEETSRLTVVNPSTYRGLTRNEVSILSSMLKSPIPGIISL